MVSELVILYWHVRHVSKSEHCVLERDIKQKKIVNVKYLLLLITNINKFKYTFLTTKLHRCHTMFTIIIAYTSSVSQWLFYWLD